MIFYTKWKDNSVTFVDAEDKDDARFKLDYYGCAKLKDIHEMTDGFMVTLFAKKLTNDFSEVGMEEVGETLFDLMNGMAVKEGIKKKKVKNS